MCRLNLVNNVGSTLILSFLIIIVLLSLGIAFVSRSIVESRIAEKQRQANQAFCLAEAGLERAFYELKQDFENDDTDPSWADGDINGIACGPDSANFYTLFATTSLGNGNYQVQLKNVSGNAQQIWIKAIGTVNDIGKTIQSYIKVKNVSPWNQVIFAGSGASGQVINGNVNIRGSVHILGEGLQPTDLAIEMDGNSDIGNNYDGIDPTLLAKIPPAPTVMFNGEMVETLNATLRIKRGMASLSGSAIVGDQDIPGNAYKETMDGTFVTDGYTGNQGASSVFSDNGTGNAYDLGNSVSFPSLQDPHPNPNYDTFEDYFKANAYVVNSQAELDQLADIEDNSNFSIGDALGSIGMDGNGNLTVQGLIYIDNGGNLNIGAHTNGTITYTGRGTVLATGNVVIDSSLLTAGDNSFPANVLGIMTPNEIGIGLNQSQIDVMGAFFAENKIKCAKQTDVVGTFFSNYFDMGTNVPDIYQVPDLADNLPPAIIDAEPYWTITIVLWQMR